MIHKSGMLPERFHRRVIVAISFARHTAKSLMLNQNLPKLMAGILRATIRMHDQSMPGPFSKNRLPEGIFNQLCLEMVP